MAAITRHWSTIFQGALLDEAAFRRDIGKLVAGARHPGPAPAPAPHATDADGALAEMRQSFGFVPGFIAAVPREALPGAWLELAELELSPATQLPAKYKSLIGLAVASQIPCRYCVIGDTEFAKLAGASEREIHEAVAMAALARNWSTLLNGLQVDEVAYRRDIDRLVKAAQHPAPQALAGKGAH
jgi:AhpD family alkylhydroperoxidase